MDLAENDYKDLINKLNLGVYIFDIKKQHVVYINPAIEKMLGRPADQVTDLSWDLKTDIHEEDRDLVMESIAKLGSSSEANVDIEFRLKHQNGNYIWFKSRNTGFKLDEDGKPEQFLGTLIDISTEKTTQARLEASEQEFREAFENSPIGMALVSPLGNWIKVNQSVSQILGYSEDELKKITFQDITHPEDLEKDLDLVKETLEGKRESFQMEKRYLNKEGETIWAILSVTLTRDLSGEPRHFVSQIEDITSIKNQEKKLKSSLSDLERFNTHMINREAKMIELKTEVNSLLNQLGQPKKYNIN